MRLLSKNGKPGALFLNAVGVTTDTTTSGKGVVYNPDYLETTDFADATEDLADVSGKTFTGTGGNYFAGQVVRFGSNDGNSYVVTGIDGTTITVDRDIIEENGEDIFISQYLSLITAYNVDEPYPEDDLIFLLPASGYSNTSVKVITPDDATVTLEPDNANDIALFPVKKLVRDDSNIDTLIYCKPF